MKVAIYSHSIAPSIDGVCRRYSAILHELSRRKHETLLFTMEEEPEDIPASTRTVFLDYMIFPSYPNKKVSRLTFRSLYAIIKNLSSFKPDVLHIVADGFSQMFVLAALLLGIPVVGSFHTDIIDLLNTHNAFAIQKLMVVTKELTDYYVLDSTATTSISFAEKLNKRGIHPEHTIITAVDSHVFSATKRSSMLRKELMFGDTSGFLCVYVGRISNEKRMDVIIEAMRNLTGKKNVYFAIIGDGPSAALYAKGHGKENKLYCKPRFLSHAELAQVYASSDLHVTASEFETLGNTVLESHACSRPVVAPRTQGFNDTVRHGIDGFLFNPGDSEDATHFIQKMIDDDDLRTQMGQAGHDAVAHRSISFVVSDLFKWYAVGQSKRQQRSRGEMLISTILLTVAMPLYVLLFWSYDKLVNVLLKPFISYAEHAAILPALSDIEAKPDDASISNVNSTDASYDYDVTQTHSLDSKLSGKSETASSRKSSRKVKKNA